MATGSNVSGKVTPPAICLMVAAGLNVLMSLYWIFSGLNATLNSGQITKELKNNPQVNADQFTTMMNAFGVGFVLWGVLGLLCAAVIVFAGIKMKSLQAHGLAMTGAVLAMIPCTGPCCFFSLPLGIWALVVLMSPDVKAAFH